MGAQMSVEEKAICTLLLKILQSKGIKYDEYKIKLTLKWLKAKGEKADSVTAFAIETWQRAGEKIWEAAPHGDATAAEIMTTWRLILETLKEKQTERKALGTATAVLNTTPAAPPDKGDSTERTETNLIDFTETKKEPCQKPSAPLPSFDEPASRSEELDWPPPLNAGTSYDPVRRWREDQRQASADGAATVLTFPVIVKDGAPNEWKGCHRVARQRKYGVIQASGYLFTLSKGGTQGETPANRIAKALYVMNHLSLTGTDQLPPICKHFKSGQTVLGQQNVLVMARSPATGKWFGPVKLLTWGRGYACVVTENGPLWVPAQCIRPYVKNVNKEAGAQMTEEEASLDLTIFDGR
ncbi:endogenous retrovirus group k member 25 pol [Limosa lapponica baueri]|uniref:Endogenous retrovirus group k member 25 pol n=1 Tax=Limosa lapponica baueri TaxID=1758121 RepID=A0A2I0TIK2_LIMLA|nr:endogenous retrovirus group k member 25 pol [Limosa lapponica baueri]